MQANRFTDMLITYCALLGQNNYRLGLFSRAHLYVVGLKFRVHPSVLQMENSKKGGDWGVVEMWVEQA